MLESLEKLETVEPKPFEENMATEISSGELDISVESISNNIGTDNRESSSLPSMKLAPLHVELTGEQIKEYKSQIKISMFGNLEARDELVGTTSAYRVYDWKDTKTFEPILMDDKVKIYKDHLTGKMFVLDSAGYKAQLEQTSWSQRLHTGFRYTYKNISGLEMGMKDVK